MHGRSRKNSKTILFVICLDCRGDPASTPAAASMQFESFQRMFARAWSVASGHRARAARVKQTGNGIRQIFHQLADVLPRQ
jgi:hypothetical protein